MSKQIGKFGEENKVNERKKEDNGSPRRNG